MIALVLEIYQQVKVLSDDDYGNDQIIFAAEQLWLKNTILKTSFCECDGRRGISESIYRMLVLAFILVPNLVIISFDFAAFISPERNVIDLMYHTPGLYIFINLFFIVCFGINMIVLFDNILWHHRCKDYFVWDIRQRLLTPFKSLYLRLSKVKQSFTVRRGDDEKLNRNLMNFERTTNEIVNESEGRIRQLIAESEKRVIQNEMKMQYYIETLINDALPRKSSDEDYISLDDSDSSGGGWTRSKLDI